MGHLFIWILFVKDVSFEGSHHSSSKAPTQDSDMSWQATPGESQESQESEEGTSQTSDNNHGIVGTTKFLEIYVYGNYL